MAVKDQSDRQGVVNDGASFTYRVVLDKCPLLPPKLLPHVVEAVCTVGSASRAASAALLSVSF